MSKAIDRIESTSIDLNTILGLLQTTDDLLSDNISLLIEYPSKDTSEKKRAKRLADKLLALSSASIQTTYKAKKELEKATRELFEGGVR